VTQATPTLGSFYNLYAVGGTSSMSMPNLKRIALFKSYKGGPKISKLGHVTHTTPTLGSFCGPYAVGVHPLAMSVPNLKHISLFVPKLYKRGSQNFEIWSRDLGHAHFMVVL